MEKSYKNVLRSSRQRIVDDLDVTDVLDRLLGEEVVGVELDDYNHNDNNYMYIGGQRGADGGDLVQTCEGREGSLLAGCSRQERWWPSLSSLAHFPLMENPLLGPKAFVIFLDSLRENYSWLADLMMENHAVDGGQKTAVIF